MFSPLDFALDFFSINTPQCAAKQEVLYVFNGLCVICFIQY